jgi:hypothetical protein
VVNEPFMLGSREIPVGKMIAPCIYLVHRRPDLYGPDPYAFRPERFLDRAPETYSWLPFGGGMRRCIGASFALLEMTTILRAVAGSVQLSPAGGSEHEMIARRAIFFAPSRGGEVVVA